MTIAFKPATRENVSLLIGLAGGTGAGKTFTALRLASGIAGDKPFALIDTENRRSLHYADKFKFDAGELRAPFSPDAYAEAILAADKAGYPVIVVDSATHEWAGSGGVLDMQESELNRMAGDDWKKREACKMAAWIKPKMRHKQMVSRLLQVRAHVILCFRAEEKIEMVRDDKGKMQITAKHSLTGLDGWIPVCEKNLPFELTVSFLLTAARPGVPLPIKLPDQLRAMFPLDRPVDESCGQKIAAWARGGVAPAVDLKGNPQADPPVDPDQQWLSGLIASMKTKTTLADLNALMDHPNVKTGLARRPSIVGDAEAARHDREMQIDALQFMAEKASEPHVPVYETGGDDAG